MIKRIAIKNFKASADNGFDFGKDCLIIGGNDSGKSTILQALNVFFNEEKIDTDFVRNPDEDVEIGILLDDYSFIKKIYKGKTHKLSSVVGDETKLAGIKYIYLNPESLDVETIIVELATAKNISKLAGTRLENDLKNIFESSINEVISSIDPSFIVVNSSSTTLIPETTPKIANGVKYGITSSGVPINGRGLGYKKNLVYSLLVGSEYDNVIVGIDEIENSLSISNVKELLKIVKTRFMQSLITTHSTLVMSSSHNFYILPLVNGEAVSTAKLLESIGDLGDKKFVLCEGKTDMQWIKKTLQLLSKENEFLVIQCGGHTNIQPVYDELVKNGKSCFIIKDGDSGDSLHSLSKECIELYIPLNEYKNLIDSHAISVPITKDSFFSEAHRCIPRSDDGNGYYKNLIADKVGSFLDLSNPIVAEIKKLLRIE